MVLLAGCSSGHKNTGSNDSAALLAGARTSLAAASSLHFTLTSTNVPSTGTRLVAGEGVVARPKQFQGNSRSSSTGTRSRST